MRRHRLFLRALILIGQNGTRIQEKSGFAIGHHGVDCQFDRRVDGLGDVNSCEASGWDSRGNPGDLGRVLIPRRSHQPTFCAPRPLFAEIDVPLRDLSASNVRFDPAGLHDERPNIEARQRASDDSARCGNRSLGLPGTQGRSHPGKRWDRSRSRIRWILEPDPDAKSGQIGPMPTPRSWSDCHTRAHNWNDCARVPIGVVDSTASQDDWH
jgi:hypothetical protein